MDAIFTYQFATRPPARRDPNVLSSEPLDPGGADLVLRLRTHGPATYEEALAQLAEELDRLRCPGEVARTAGGAREGE